MQGISTGTELKTDRAVPFQECFEQHWMLTTRQDIFYFLQYGLKLPLFSISVL